MLGIVLFKKYPFIIKSDDYIKTNRIISKSDNTFQL